MTTTAIDSQSVYTMGRKAALRRVLELIEDGADVDSLQVYIEDELGFDELHPHTHEQHLRDGHSAVTAWDRCKRCALDGVPQPS